MSSQELLNQNFCKLPDSFTDLFDDVNAVKNHLKCLGLPYTKDEIANLLLEYECNVNRVEIVVNRIIDERASDIEITFEKKSAVKSSTGDITECFIESHKESSRDSDVVIESEVKEEKQEKAMIDYEPPKKIPKSPKTLRILFSKASDAESIITDGISSFASFPSAVAEPHPNNFDHTLPSTSNHLEKNGASEECSENMLDLSIIDSHLGIGEIEEFLSKKESDLMMPDSTEALDKCFNNLNNCMKELKGMIPLGDNELRSYEVRKIDIPEHPELLSSAIENKKPESSIFEKTNELNHAISASEEKKENNSKILNSSHNSISSDNKSSSTIDPKNLTFQPLNSIKSKKLLQSDSPEVLAKTPVIISSSSASNKFRSGIFLKHQVQSEASSLNNLEKEPQCLLNTTVSKTNASSIDKSAPNSATHFSLVDENLNQINNCFFQYLDPTLYKIPANSVLASNSSMNSVSNLPNPSKIPILARKDFSSSNFKFFSDSLDTRSARGNEVAENQCGKPSFLYTPIYKPSHPEKYFDCSKDTRKLYDDKNFQKLNHNTVQIISFNEPNVVSSTRKADEPFRTSPPDAVRSIPTSSQTNPPVLFSLKTELVLDSPKPSTSSSKTIEPVPSTSKGSVETVSPANKSEAPETMPEFLPNLMEIFPDADTNYLRKICKINFKDKGKRRKQEVLQDLISIVMENPNYPRRILPNPETNLNLSYEERFQNIMEMLPNIDPEYLENKCQELTNSDNYNKFVNELLTTKQYPTLKDYEKRKETEKMIKAYTENFSIPAFLEVFPDPKDYFMNKKKNGKHLNHSIAFLRQRFPFVKVEDVGKAFKAEDHNLTRTCLRLENFRGILRKKRRSSYECKMPPNVDVLFLQEICYINNKEAIEDYIRLKKKEKEDAFNKAKMNGDLYTCGCCYDDEVMKEDVITCPEGHLFCRNCVKQATEIKIGERSSTLSCMSDGCSAVFTLKDMQSALTPNTFSTLVKIRQSDEIKAAGIEGLVSCPFCDFASIPPPEDKIFKCLNPDCMKESCKLCNHESHIPLRCDEVERSVELKARLLIEEKMTEALMRECWKCKMKFIKEDGCNKMTCTNCKAMMCYICRQPVTDYNHFNGDAGPNVHLCPLYSENDLLHVEAVRITAQEMKNKLLRENPNLNFKNDPTLVLPENQYKKKNVPHFRQQQQGLVLNKVIPADIPRDNLPPIDLRPPDPMIPGGLLVHQHQPPPVAPRHGPRPGQLANDMIGHGRHAHIIRNGLNARRNIHNNADHQNH